MTERLTLGEYQSRMRVAGAGDPRDAAFKCPLCGKVSTGADFQALGADPQRAPQECIGRVAGAKGGLHSKVPVPQPCDWCAFGLFGTLNGGVLVTLPDGREIAAFEVVEPA